MDDSMKTDSRLEVSVSFGRFENDALSWEKWSSFSPNKYLEEVGNLSTPGSVAQKKAYFEAHYKKIAAKKAEEEMEQEKSTGPVSPSPDASIEVDCSANSSHPDIIKFDLSNDEKLVEEIVNVKTNVDVFNEARCDNNDRLNGFVDVIDSDEEKDDVNSAVVKCESSEIEETKDESSVSVDGPELNVGNVLPVVLETPKKGSRDIVEKRASRKNSREQQASVQKKENSKSSTRNITQMVTPIKKEKNSVTTKKKIASPVTKVTRPLQAATPRISKPALTSTPLSASRALKKNINGPQQLKSNDFSARETKRAAPTSLHMSLSLGPTNSVGGLAMTRKSLIMESMGDKDIVKRAFKTFQNRSNGSMGDEKTSTIKHVASTALEPKVSSFHTPTKGNIGPRKGTEKTATPRSHPGAKSNPLPSVSHKSSALGRKNTAAVSPNAVLKSEEKSEKRKEFLKKLEAKSIAREAANAQLNAKSRGERRSFIFRCIFDLARFLYLHAEHDFQVSFAVQKRQHCFKYLTVFIMIKL
ncbi:hypothetical protein PHJA_001758500 [Phtheirospermum japonicum]|uniref:Protein WVD2-like 7 n=1 Tax=Phtheirospermum japonicum TaxID=374723 RepID=A0A830CIL8_9LAMI|nr:hypothetical protein PHJA_001758500 [Phtheirospermum japonicum]